MSRSGLFRLQLVELLGQTRFFSGCGFLVHRARGSGLVELLADKPELFGRRFDIASLQIGLKMLDLRFYPALTGSIGRPVLDVLFGSFFRLQRMCHFNLPKTS